MCVVTFDWERNDAEEKLRTFNQRERISWIVLEVTDYCNFNCRWCFANSATNRNPKHMSLGELKLLISSLAGEGVKQITFSGGEPTLYPHIKEGIRLAKEHSMVVHMNTNGFVLSRSLASELRRAGLSQVQINIDSMNPKEHDFIRGKEGSHARALKALKNAREAGITCVSQTVVTKKNEGQVVDIFSLARNIGVQRCRVWDMTPSDGRAKDNSRLMPSDYIDVLRRLTEYAESSGATNIEIGDPLFKPHIKTSINTSGGFCVAAAGLYATVSRSGEVFFCATYRKPLFNLFDVIREGGEINSVYKSKLKGFLNGFGDNEKCKGCKFISHCKSGCYTRREFDAENLDYFCHIIS